MEKELKTFVRDLPKTSSWVISNLFLFIHLSVFLIEKNRIMALCLYFVEARGTQSHDGYWEKKNGELASGDDITCFVLPIKDVRDHLLKDL